MQYFIEKQRTPFTQQLVTNICNFALPVAGTIKTLRFRAPLIAGVGWKFVVRKNGTAITPANPADLDVITLGPGTVVTRTGLAIAAAAGDVISVDMLTVGTASYWSGFEFTLGLEDGSGRLAGLADVDLSGVTDSDVLLYDAGSGLWIAGTAGGGASALDDLTDVAITAPSTGQVLKFNGTDWVNDADATGGGASALDDLTDVVITAPSTGQVLKFNGTDWVNGTDATGGSSSLAGLSDVNVSGVSDKDALIYDSGTSKWVKKSVLFTRRNPDIAYDSPNGFDDEFTGSSLDAKWSVYNSGFTQAFDQTDFPSFMACTPSGSGGQHRGVYQTPTTGNGDEFAMKISRFPNYTDHTTKIGFLIHESSTRFSFTADFATTGTAVIRWEFWSSNSAISNASQVFANHFHPGTLFLRFKLGSSAPRIRFAVSNDGVIWTPWVNGSSLGAGDLATASLDKLGIFCASISTAPTIGVPRIDWVRKVQSGLLGKVANYYG